MLIILNTIFLYSGLFYDATLGVGGILSKGKMQEVPDVYMIDLISQNLFKIIKIILINLKYCDIWTVLG